MCVSLVVLHSLQASFLKLMSYHIYRLRILSTLVHFLDIKYLTDHSWEIFLPDLEKDVMYHDNLRLCSSCDSVLTDMKVFWLTNDCQLLVCNVLEMVLHLMLPYKIKLSRRVTTLIFCTCIGIKNSGVKLIDDSLNMINV